MAQQQMQTPASKIESFNKELWLYMFGLKICKETLYPCVISRLIKITHQLKGIFRCSLGG